MKRRDFIAGLGGAAAWPMVARAQRQRLPTIGLLINGPPTETDYITAPFRKGLADTGNVEGRDLLIEYRWADGYNERLPVLTSELIDLDVAVIVAIPGSAAALAAKRLTSTIPIVFYTSGDAVGLGLVASLNKPEGNLTGVSGVTNSLITKQLGFLSDLLPTSASFALLTNPKSPNTEDLVQNTRAAAETLGHALHVVSASDEGELDADFLLLSERHISGLVVPANSFLRAQRTRLIALAANNHIATVYDAREFVEAGGLISYGVDQSELYHQIGVYTGKILRGAKLSELPVFRPSKFELVINLKTAKALGLEIPAQLLARADEVIE